MAQSIPALVEPSVLRWARESIGLVPVAAARKIGVPDGRVAEWEAGTAAPSIAQLRKAADVYKRPLGVFFLPEPPVDFDTMRDFRRHVGAKAGEWSPDLHGEYRRALTQRESALELAEIDDAPPPTTWQLTALPPNDEALASVARDMLLSQSPLGLPGPSGTKYEHLNAWVAALEEAEVLVLATSGGKVLTTEMRAFSLYFEILPVIMVNGSDAARGRLFSLLHEFVHLLLHTGGLCDTVTDAWATTPDRQLEARCNAIAAAMLMPRDAVLSNPEVAARKDAPQSWMRRIADAHRRRVIDSYTVASFLECRGGPDRASRRAGCALGVGVYGALDFAMRQGLDVVWWRLFESAGDTLVWTRKGSGWKKECRADESIHGNEVLSDEGAVGRIAESLASLESGIPA